MPTSLRTNEPHDSGKGPAAGAAAAARARTPANRFGVDYRAEAARLGAPVVPMIDAHAHVMGEAAKIYDDARRCFGVDRTYSMTQLHQAERVRDMFGGSLRFIAFPSFGTSDRGEAFRGGYLEAIETFHQKFGSRMVKLWRSPKLRQVIPDLAGVPYGTTDLAEVDSPWSIRQCELGERLGMMFMIHIADPDTWYRAKYNDPRVFGEKRAEYERLERMLDRFTAPWIGAHMGGWPEDLDFLDGLLSRHPNLYLDTSATKWVVRALGGWERKEFSRAAGRMDVREFFLKWGGKGAGGGRLIFGSDIVSSDDHLTPKKAGTSFVSDLADSPDAAFDLYASRYWALRTMFETEYAGESNIADPDLMMTDPTNFDAMSAPTLRGLSLPREVLCDLYRGTAERVIESWWREHA